MRRYGISSLVMAGLFALLPLAALADAPAIAISPIIPEYDSFPATVSVSFTVTHAPVGSIRLLSATVTDGEDTSDIFRVGQQASPNNINPFNDNACAQLELIAGSVVTNCSVANGNGSANVTFDWTVATDGTYTLTIAAQHGSSTGADDEEVTFEPVVVRLGYTAPPSLANAYIKANPDTFGKLTGGCRGYIISEIASNSDWGAYSQNGQRGGPYLLEEIEKDVDSFFASCPQKK
jgi:hypothetical protein